MLIAYNMIDLHADDFVCDGLMFMNSKYECALFVSSYEVADLSMQRNFHGVTWFGLCTNSNTLALVLVLALRI